MLEIKRILFTLVLFVFTACNTNTDVDTEKSNSNLQKFSAGVLVKEIPKCTANGSKDALVVAAKSKIEKQGDEPSKIKIWHYQDSTQLLCLLSGDAVLIVKE